MRLRRSPLASLALLSALTLGAGCKTDKRDSEPSPDAPKPSEPAKPEPGATKAPSTSAALPESTTPPIDSPAITELGEVIATVQLPGGAAMSDLAPIVDSFKPGSSALLAVQAPTMLGQLAGMSLDGAKLSAPISIVVLDPSTYPQPIGLLVETEDLELLRASANKVGHAVHDREGRALIGPPALVDSAEDFAFANLSKVPDHSEIVIYPAPLRRAFADKIGEALAQIPTAMAGTGFEGTMTKMVEMYVQTFEAMSEQTERIVISASPSQTSNDLFMRFYPVAGTTFASFIAAQTPADHSLLAKLPANAGQGGLMSGELRAGAAKDAMLGFMIEAIQMLYSNTMTSEAWTKLVNDWIATLDGRFTASFSMDLANPATPSMRMLTVFGSTDEAAMRAAWRAMMGAMTMDGAPLIQMMGMSVNVVFEPGALDHEGVPVDRYTTKIDASTMTPEAQAAMQKSGGLEQIMHMAAFDQLGAMASSADDMAELIDAARGKTKTFEPSKGIQRAMEVSQARGESLFYYLDFAALLPAGSAGELPFGAMVMGMGKQGEALSVCLSLRK